MKIPKGLNVKNVITMPNASTKNVFVSPVTQGMDSTAAVSIVFLFFLTVTTLFYRCQKMMPKSDG